MNWVKGIYAWLSAILYREDRILAEVAKIEAWLQSSGQSQISDKLDIIIANQEQIMSDLATAVADLKAEVAAIGDKMDADFAALKAALAANDPAATAAAVSSIEASVQVLKDAATRDTLAPATPATPGP